MVLTLTTASLRAEVLTWDGDTVTAGLQDGGGTWNTTATDRWFNPAALPSPAYQPWNNATPDSAIFGQGGAGPYTVTLGEAITVEDLTFQTTGYTIAGGGNTLTLATGSNITVAGTAGATLTASLAGTNGFTKEGTGTLTLGGGTANTLTGTITVNGGSLTIAANNRIADTSNVEVNGGGVNFGGFTDTIANFTQTTAAAGGSISGTNANLTITGTLRIASSGTGAGFTVNTGAQVSAQTVDIRGSAYSGTNNESILLGGNAATLAAQLTVGAGGLLMDGQTIQMNAGPKGNRILLNGNVTASGTNVFRMDAAAVAGAVHEIDLGGGTRTFDITGGTTTIGSAIVIVNGALTKTGAGTLTLSGTAANTYTGLTTVSGGTLSMTKTVGINAIAGNVLVNGGTLSWGASNNDQIADTSSITISSGTLVFNNRNETLLNLTKTGGEMTTQGGTVTIQDTLAVSGGTSNGSQGWAWTVNSGGTTIANKVDFSGFVNASNGNAVLQIGGNSTSVIGALNVGSGGLLLDGQTLTLNPGTGLNALGSQILLNGDVIASGTNTFAANTGTPVATSVTRIDMGTGTRTWNITGGTTTVNSAIGVIGSANLVKTGAGTLQFNSVTAYTGKTTVSQGTLALNATGRIDSSPWIQVDSGATLNVSAISGGYSYASAGTGVISGSGTIQGSLNIGAGKVLKPGTTSDPANINTAGDGIGTLTVTGNLVFNPTAPATVAELKILNPASADRINIGGSLTLDGNSNIVVTFDSANPFAPAFGQSWTLIDWAGSLDATGFSTGTNLRTGNNADGNEGNLDLPELSAGYFWQVSNFSGSGSLTVSIVPEPGKALLFVLGVLGMLFRRRRQ
ncbi:PEP-CTERM sorting domain-containing protein [Roseimicrobium sp. ORNL1]|uniref:beta strand repeat-containing protein n=1 Tax=Roseimicrobium sp. ORNL1 TaxID=2711231 RepID=UPI0013E116F3|nr:PEP-CTERM sorting domain-containing protein [Roseimicrobium sp. ORNL1]QIF01501.1 PEP-CTERM sorting domain-containing protein [Roseimicrobium sp. ORNL1]